jgi:hypothetical protein
MPALDLEIAELPASRLPITRIDYRLDGGPALELPGGTAAGTRQLLLASTASVAVQIRAVSGGRAGPWSVAKTAVPYDVPSEPEPEPEPEPIPQGATIYVDPTRAASGDGLTPATALKALPAGPFAAGTTIKVRSPWAGPGLALPGVENWKDVLIEGATITDSGGYGIAMYNCSNSYAVGCNIERSGTTCMTMRFNEGCGFIGNTMKDPSNVHGNAMSLYEGNTDCLILFNTCRITNAESSSPGMVAHGLNRCTVAFNIARNASDGVTMQQHVPGGAYKPGYGTGLGDGPFNIWANNVALNAGKVAFNIRDNGNPGSTVVNNIVDTLAYNKMPIGDGWVNVEDTYDTASSEERAAYLRPVTRRRNVWTRTYSLGSTYPIQSAQRSALEEPVRTGTARSALFADLANEDLRPADPLLLEGHAWSFSYGTFSTVIDWIGRYRPDGGEAFDWRSVNWGNLK